jgi:transketolase
MRDAFARGLYQAAKKNPKIFMVVADISPAASMAPYREEFPDRFADVGVAEQAMVGMCAGLALRGLIPFAYTIAPFTIYRPFEQVRDDLCYQCLPVTLVGVGAGLSYPSLGGTHWAQEDIALMSALPNMSIIAPCDPLELEEAIGFCATNKGPTYLRLGKAGEPNLTENAPDPFVFGKARCIKAGTECCFLTYGPITKMAMDLAVRIEQEFGQSTAVFSIHTLKPLDYDGISTILKNFPVVTVIEEHSLIGGLGARVKEIAWDSGASCKLNTFGLKDEFIHFYGSQDELRAQHGLDSASILKNIF